MSNKIVHVVAAAIENSEGNILIAKRPPHVHQGGLWEFPGGKVEDNEKPYAALTRELLEECDILAQDFSPLIQITHHYPDKSVFLDVMHVKSFSGNAIGNEGQTIKWVKKEELDQYQFPKANKPIIDALVLPPNYLITPDYPVEDSDLLLGTLEKKLVSGIKLIQLRAKQLDDEQFFQLYVEVNRLTEKYGATLFSNMSTKFAEKNGIKRIHLTADRLQKLSPLKNDVIYSASCHNQKEIEKACQLGVQFIVIAPVKKTTTHPETTPLGWDKFQALCKLSTVPVYALGGMCKQDMPEVIQRGGQGIAAISSLWNGE